MGGRERGRERGRKRQTLNHRTNDRPSSHPFSPPPIIMDLRLSDSSLRLHEPGDRLRRTLRGAFRRVVDAKAPEGGGVTLDGLGALGPSPCVESHSAADSLVL